MTAAYAERRPGCFAAKGSASVCPHCGYDESLKRGPLVLAHRTLLNHGQYRHDSAPAPNRNCRPSSAGFDGNPPRRQPTGEPSKNFLPLCANHFGSQRCQMLAKQFRRVKTAKTTRFNVGNANPGGIAQG